MSGVERDDEVEAREPGRPELPGPVVLFVSGSLQDGDGARVGAVALVPAAGSGAVHLDQGVEPGLCHAGAEDGFGHG